MSNHFTIEELTFSQTAVRKGIDNSIPRDLIANLYLLVDGLEQVRSLLDAPMSISSGYRSPKLNASIGGAKTSQHMQALAADFTCPQFGTPLEIVKEIAASEIEYDQVIQEGTWVHISFATNNPRKQVLTANFTNGKATYTQGV